MVLKNNLHSNINSKLEKSIYKRLFLYVLVYIGDGLREVFKKTLLNLVPNLILYA